MNKHAEGSIASLFGNSLYHTGSDDADGWGKIEDQEEVGDKPQEEIDEELGQRVNEAKNAGLSSNGCNRLKQMLRKHHKAFRLRLGSGGPAKVTPMKIIPIDGKKPILVKVWRYPSEQRTFLMNTCLNWWNSVLSVRM